MFNTVKSFLRLSIIGSVLLIPSLACAQTGLLFDTKEINLGYIPEDTGNVVVDFVFSNTSKKTLILTEVDTHGGCSLLSSPQDSIVAGQKNKISIKVNPKNRPGTFERKISFRTMPDSIRYDLVIKAYVEPADKVWNENTNETSYGNLTVSSDYIRIGNVLENSKVERTIKIKNTGKDPISFLFAKAKVPQYIFIKGLPDKLAAGIEATLTITIDFSASQKLGRYLEMVEIPFGKSEEHLIIYIIGKITPYAAKTPTQPKVEMLLKEVDLTEISAEKPLQGSFVLKNSGLSPLLIRKVETSCLCIDLEHKTPIAPGASATLYFMFDPRGLKGIEEKRIILYTNAPDQPIITLLVKAKVIP